jgi:hypothetical protein
MSLNSKAVDQRTAAVVLFIFNRPRLTAQVYEQIRIARPLQLFVVADGPRPGREADAELCEAARALVSSPDWPCELRTNFAETNLGVGRRISSGLDWVFQQCAEAIILEDDCVPGPSFFSFCSHLLEYYREDERVMHISGENYQDGRRRGPASYFFSRYTLSWGWASWARAWHYYDFSFGLWPIARDEGWLAAMLDDPEEVGYWTTIFDRLYGGQIDTWDYQWQFTCWCQNGLSIQPDANLVTNLGVGADATNYKEDWHSTIGLPTESIETIVHPSNMTRHRDADCYTFKEHIAPKPISRLQMLQNRIALRSRMRNLLRHMPLPRLRPQVPQFAGPSADSPQ